MFAAIVAFIFILLNLFIWLGIIANVSVQAGAILNLVGFVIVLIVGFVPLPADWSWHR